MSNRFDDYRRRSVCLRDYDYAQEGLYFVTVCVAGRVPLFGEIIAEGVSLSDAGCIVAEEWMRTPELHSEVTLDAFIVMPDHLHGIVCIAQRHPEAHGYVEGVVPTRVAHTLGAIVRGFKAAASGRIGYSVWQRSYYETIICDQRHLDNVRHYITNNPRNRSNPDTPHP